MALSKEMRYGILIGAVAVVLMLAFGVVFFLQAVERIEAQKAQAMSVYGPVPAFSLVERSGRSFGREDLEGKVWVVNFIFTHCAGPCPVLSGQMAGLQAAFGDMEDVRLVSVSVDPERDTPPVLSGYADRYGAHPERWVFLTGERSAVYGLIREGFKLVVEDEDPETDQILHSLRFALVDRMGRVRGYYDGMDPDLARRLLPNVRRLLRGQEGRL